MNTTHIFRLLCESKPMSLVELPPSFGIYALWDHEDQIRYIGCTPKATESFRVRVANKHVTGSEGRSHKFSQAYCVSRMWRYAPKLHAPAAGAKQNTLDAKIAKQLRTLFIRKHCKVTLVELPPNELSGGYFQTLTRLEAEIQVVAPKSMRAWEGVRFLPCEEPRELVNQLLDENVGLRAGAERQNCLYLQHVKGREGPV